MFDFLDVYPWLLPLIIFVGRIFDVSLGTLRIIFVSKGAKHLAPAIGFVEVFIWIVVISQILTQANDLISIVLRSRIRNGELRGNPLENRIAYGIVLCRIYTQKSGKDLVQTLNKMNIGATLTHGTGSTNEVDIIETW